MNEKKLSRIQQQKKKNGHHNEAEKSERTSMDC